jgi:RsiW-degrading membrane proteinase PrsW (M82 family)
MPDAMLTTLGVIAGVLALVAAVSYIQSIVRGETKPERGAFIIWGVTSTISFLAYWADGAQDSLWFVIGDFLVGIIMVGLALKYGYGWKLKRHSLAFLAAGLGLVLWATTDQPFLALLCSVGVDAVGAVLIMLKAYEAPRTEQLRAWVIYLVGALLALIAVGKWDLTLLFYPAYAAVSTAGVIGAIMLGRAKRPMPPEPKKGRRIEERIP